MPRSTNSTLDFSTLTAEPAESFAPSGGAVPDSIVAAVRQSLREGKPLQFTVPGDGKDAANVKALAGYLRRAADADGNGLSVRTEDVKDRSGKVTQVRVKFQTKAEKIQGRGRKPADKPAESNATA